jgi:1,2-phenylacetyl-CoA epoxidase catalytic subunit
MSIKKKVSFSKHVVDDKEDFWVEELNFFEKLAKLENRMNKELTKSTNSSKIMRAIIPKHFTYLVEILCVVSFDEIYVRNRDFGIKSADEEFKKKMQHHYKKRFNREPLENPAKGMNAVVCIDGENSNKN